MSFTEINEILKETASRMSFKDITNEEDVILLILEHTMLWAVVSRIGEEDDERVREVIVKLLSIPPLEIHLHINNNQLDGEESFKIENNDAFMKAVDFENSYLPEDVKEIYKKETEENNGDGKNITIPGSTSVN